MMMTMMVVMAVCVDADRSSVFGMGAIAAE